MIVLKWRVLCPVDEVSVLPKFVSDSRSNPDSVNTGTGRSKCQGVEEKQRGEEGKGKMVGWLTTARKSEVRAGVKEKSTRTTTTCLFGSDWALLVVKQRVIKARAKSTINVCQRNHASRTTITGRHLLSVHWITYPSNWMTRRLNSVDMSGEVITDLQVYQASSARITSDNERALNKHRGMKPRKLTLVAPYRVIRVTRPDSLFGFATIRRIITNVLNVPQMTEREVRHTVQQSDQFLIRHRGSNLDSYRVPNTSEIFDMCTSERPSTVTNPQEMGRGVVVRFLSIRLIG